MNQSKEYPLVRRNADGLLWARNLEKWLTEDEYAEYAKAETASRRRWHTIMGSSDNVVAMNREGL